MLFAGGFAQNCWFGFQFVDRFGAVGLLALGLLCPVAEGVATAPCTFANNDLVDLQVLGDALVSRGPGQHNLDNQIDTAYRHAQRIVSPAAREHLQIGHRDHARIAQEQAARALPTTQIGFDLFDDCTDVHRVAWGHPVPHREALARDCQTDNNLQQVASRVLRAPHLRGAA